MQMINEGVLFAFPCRCDLELAPSTQWVGPTFSSYLDGIRLFYFSIHFYFGLISFKEFYHLLLWFLRRPIMYVSNSTNDNASGIQVCLSCLINLQSMVLILTWAIEKSFGWWRPRGNTALPLWVWIFLALTLFPWNQLFWLHIFFRNTTLAFLISRFQMHLPPNVDSFISSPEILPLKVGWSPGIWIWNTTPNDYCESFLAQLIEYT